MVRAESFTQGDRTIGAVTRRVRAASADTVALCAPTRADTTRTKHPHQPHSPPPGHRFRIAGADLSASVAVFLIALPLSLGIALATGAPLQAGLVAAAVGGLVAGRLGGAPLAVSGPPA